MVLRTVCRITSPRDIARSLKWWQRCREKGERFGVRDADIEAAIRGVSQVKRMRTPWVPPEVFCKRNASLWLEAMAAGRKMQGKGPSQIGAVMAELARRGAGSLMRDER